MTSAQVPWGALEKMWVISQSHPKLNANRTELSIVLNSPLPRHCLHTVQSVGSDCQVSLDFHAGRQAESEGLKTSAYQELLVLTQK